MACAAETGNSMAKASARPRPASRFRGKDGTFDEKIMWGYAR